MSAATIGDKIVISASNYYPDRDGEIDLQGRTQTELLTDHFADAGVLKAFDTMYWETLHDKARPTVTTGSSSSWPGTTSKQRAT